MSRIVAKVFARLMQLALMVAIGVAATASNVLGQSSSMPQTSSSYDIGTPAESRTGLSGLSTYAPDKLETVNLANGNMVFHVPLATVGGRGAALYTLALNYNSKLWSGVTAVTPPAFSGDTAHQHFGTQFDDGIFSRPNLLPFGSGWSIQMAPGLMIRKINIDPIQNNPGKFGYKYVLTKLWLDLPDGSEVELRDALTQGAPALTPPAPDPAANLQQPPIDMNRGQVWVSTDGSAITYITDAPNGIVNSTQCDQCTLPNPALANGTAFLPDGTRLIMTVGPLGGPPRCTKIIDRNGNALDIQYGTQLGDVTYTDSLGRQVLMQSNFNAQGALTSATVTVVGYGPTPSRTITVNAGQIGQLLTSEFANLPQPIINGSYLVPGGGLVFPNATALFTLPDNVQSDDMFLVNVSMATAVSSLQLLDGRSFSFQYNKFGELAQITYPGGGVTAITYTALGSNLCESGGPEEFAPQLNRCVTERQTMSSPPTVDADWLYTYQPYSSPSISTVTATQGVGGKTLLSQAHTFLAVDDEHRDCAPVILSGKQISVGNGTGYDFFGNNLESQVVKQTGTGVGSGSQTEAKTWAQLAPIVWPPDPGSTVNAFVNDPQNGGSAEENIPNNDRVHEEDTTLDSGQEKSVVYTYDQFNNKLTITESDYGQANSGNPGNPLRLTTNVYVGPGEPPNTANPSPYCYTSLDGLGCTDGVSPNFSSAPPNPDYIIHLRRLLLSQTVTDLSTGGSGTELSSTQYEYDNYDPTVTGHAALAQNAGMINGGINGTDPYGDPWTPFSGSYEPRGNLTSVTRKVGDGTTTVGYGQYDVAGNVVAKIDPKGNTTAYGYTDNFGDGSAPDKGSTFSPPGSAFAFLTSVTNALGQMSLAQYDYARGVVTGDEDINGVVTQTTYDVYDRPLTVTAAANIPSHSAESIFTYPTSGSNMSTVSKQLDTTRYVSSETIYDGYGRPVTSGQNEDGNPASSANFTITSQATYDGLGRASTKSNPHRSSSATTDGSTLSTYDLLGRVYQVTTSDGSGNPTGTVTTTYDGNQTLVQDQAGIQRQSFSDGVGRLTEVDELQPAPSTTLYSTTIYSYVGTILTVTQGGPKSGQAPSAPTEQRTFTYDELSRLLTAANPEDGTVTYQYDADGNLLYRTDNRQVVTNYGYDVLNRLASRSYTLPSGNPNVADATPAVTFGYDKGLNGETVAYSAGRPTYVTSSVSTETIDNYDSLGRVLKSTQTTNGQPYIFGYTYDLAGDLQTETYPSGRVVTSAYDGAGRLNSLTGALMAGDAIKPYATAISYSAPGGITALNLGNGLWETTTFNSRLQPTQIGLGTSSTDTSMFQLGYTYSTPGVANNNGDVLTETITPASGTSMTQTFTYDQCNRLFTAIEGGASNPTWSRTFGYDVFGNMWASAPSGSIQLNPLTPTSQSSYSTANNNQLAASTYDAAGNQTADGQPGDQYFYDCDSRMTRCTVGGTSSIYLYDGSGERVSKTAGGITTTFAYDAGGSLIAEYGGPMPANSGTSYLTTDHLGSTRVVTNSDPTPAVISRHDYLPFGEEITQLVGGRTRLLKYGAGDDTRQKFTGQERDQESGLDFFGSRYYLSAQQRFMSPDDALVGQRRGKPQSWNLYAYVQGNPLSRTDPDGRDTIFYDQNGNQVANLEKDHAVVDNDAGTLTVNGKTYNLQDLTSEVVTHMGPAGPVSLESLQYARMAGYIAANIDENGFVPDPEQNFISRWIHGVRRIPYYEVNPASFAMPIPVIMEGIEAEPPPALSDLPGASDALSPEGRGSTGRTAPASLNEQLAMEQVRSDPKGGTIVPLKQGMTDARWPGKDGWVKMRQNVNGIEIHYVYNVQTQQVDDFKFK